MAGEIANQAKSEIKNVQVASSTGKDFKFPVASGAATGYQTGSGVSYQKVMGDSDSLRNAVLATAAMRDPRYNDLANKLYQGNFLSTRKYIDTVPEYTARAMDSATNLYSAYYMNGGKEDFTTWLDNYVAGAKPRKEEGEGGAYTGPRTTTSVTLTDEVTAAALLDNFARENLGRSLEEGEVEKYLSKFRKAEMGAPQVTTTTPQGRAASTSVTETATSKEELLRQIISKNPDFAEFQMDTTVMDMFSNYIKRGQAVRTSGS
jgi:hypothetical protein